MSLNGIWSLVIQPESGMAIRPFGGDTPADLVTALLVAAKACRPWAAVMRARLMPSGNLVPSLAATKEAHHFYPLMFYFRFHDPRYAVSRLGFVLLDLVTLFKGVDADVALLHPIRTVGASQRLVEARDLLERALQAIDMGDDTYLGILIDTALEEVKAKISAAETDE